MLNQVVLVGRLTCDPISEPNRPCKEIHLAIPRSYKNSDGEYETDFIDCELWNTTIAQSASEYCRKGDIVGVKGRLESKDNKLVVMCEKLTFLSSNNSN